MNKKSKREMFLDQIDLWTSFYRSNPHRFIKDYFGIELKLFQIIIIYMMHKVDYFMYLASRSQGKSFICAIYAVYRAILYPGSEIVIASGTKDQASKMIKKYIQNLANNSVNVAKEIKIIKTGKDENSVSFHNGSIILSVVSSDNARGERANLIIFEEYRMIKKDILDKVLRRFNGTPRQPKYLSKPEYAHLLEPNKEIYISSAFYKGHWSYEKFKSYVDAMLKGRDYFVCGLPYQLALEEGLLTQKQIDNEMAEADFDPVAFLMEMGCVWWGESEKAYYKLDDFRPNRVKSVRPFYPHATEKYLSIKNNKKKEPILKKTNGEIRLISADFAALGGHENDNTVFTCIRLLPKDDTYTRYVPFITSINGDHTENQAIALKRLYYDFDADYIVMDTQGNGVSLYDDCSKILFDQERDEEYPAWCAMNNEKLKQRALDKNAIPIIYAVTTNAEVNNEIAVKLKNNLSKGKIKFLENEIEAKDYLSDHFDFNDLPEEDKAVLLRPYIQTSALINESINLEAKYESGLVKVYETGSKRKDRWTSLAYGNHYADILEKKLIKQEDWTDISYDEYVDTF